MADGTLESTTCLIQIDEEILRKGSITLQEDSVDTIIRSVCIWSFSDHQLNFQLTLNFVYLSFTYPGIFTIFIIYFLITNVSIH